MYRSIFTRADDFGSAPAANAAILEALDCGFLLRNVSIMAAGLYLDSDASSLAAYAGCVDLGLHFTVNAEWDQVKWQPCAPKDQIPALLNSMGTFHQYSQELLDAAPPIEQLLTELEAQLQRLTALGLPISYVDGHMFPERVVPGLDGAMRAWAARHGLFYACDYDGLSPSRPAFASNYEEFCCNTAQWLEGLPCNTAHLYILHPARFSSDTIAFYNSDFPAGIVAHERDLEYRSAVDPVWHKRIYDQGLRLLRFRDLPA